MTDPGANRTHRDGEDPAEGSRGLALLSIAVLAFGAVLFTTAWMIGGQDATADNWVGVTTVMALFTGLFGSFVALVMSLVAAVRHGMSSRLWLPMATFPTVVAIVLALEAFVFE